MKTGLMIMSVLLVLVLVRPTSGVVLLNQDQALKEMFPDAAKIVPEVHVFTTEQADSAKAQLGGKWTLYQAGAKTEESTENDSVTFYFAMKEGKKTGVALVEVQPGKWGPVKYIVALDLTGKVTNLAVMSYVEQRGRPIATRRFLGQFVGKTGKNAITIGKDIDAVSGATISSRATAFAVKKVVVLYDTFYLAGAEKTGE
jgi:Na+-translocating ferredoxin:NAD+ oxidoreductase RnfG subunit